jgi:hypothetical protein
MLDERTITDPPAAAAPEPAFRVSNAMRLSARQLAGLGLFAAAIVLFVPPLWRRLEPLEVGPDYRIPYALSGDYWHFERVARGAAARCDAVLLGDSVVWGQYVRPGQTLSHHLNARAGRERFANLGVDGMHPVALAGLIDYHAGAIAGKPVVLHCNPLWMSSAKHDLSGEEAFLFNHPALVPQFVPRIPCYREEVSRRIGYVVQRQVSFLGWAHHIQLAYFGQTSIPEWALEHPYDTPASAVTLRLPDPAADTLRHRPRPWTEQGITPQDFAWVGLEASVQWRAFRRALETLRGRGSRVVVLVGPFNEHLLTEAGRAGHARVRDGIVAWLKANGVEHVAPPALPSELYADASHPLAEGYRLLAQRLAEAIDGAR